MYMPIPPNPDGTSDFRVEDNTAKSNTFTQITHNLNEHTLLTQEQIEIEVQNIQNTPELREEEKS